MGLIQTKIESAIDTSPHLIESLHMAREMALDANLAEVLPAHLALAMLEDDESSFLLQAYGVDFDKVRAQWAHQVQKQSTAKTQDRHAVFSSGIEAIMQHARQQAQKNSLSEVDSNLILAVFLSEKSSFMGQLLAPYDLDLSGVLQYLELREGKTVHIAPLQGSSGATKNPTPTEVSAPPQHPQILQQQVSAPQTPTPLTPPAPQTPASSMQTSKTPAFQPASPAPASLDKRPAPGEIPAAPAPAPVAPVISTPQPAPPAAAATPSPQRQAAPHERIAAPKLVPTPPPAPPAKLAQTPVPAPDLADKAKAVSSPQEPVKAKRSGLRSLFGGFKRSSKNRLDETLAPASDSASAAFVANKAPAITNLIDPSVIGQPASEATTSLSVQNVLQNRPARRRRSPTPSLGAHESISATGSVLEKGRLVQVIPRWMKVNKKSKAEVRITRAQMDEIRSEFDDLSVSHIHELSVTEAMTVQLRAPGGGFHIENLSPQTQWIDRNQRHVDDADFGIWRWNVTPIKAGRSRLQLVVSARTVDDNGAIHIADVPDKIIELSVFRDHGTLLTKAGILILMALISIALGYYGDIVWQSLSAISSKFGF